MIQSSSETTTTTTYSTPLSPFSSYSARSEATSDELPDLGAFTTVFRALNHLQATPRILQPQPSVTPSSSTPFSPSELESDAQPGSTVWAQRPIASYLTSQDHLTTTTETHSPDSHSPIASEEEYGSETEGEVDRAVEIEELDTEDISDIEAIDQPSLGYLDEALSFLAAERQRFAALREAGVKTGISDSSARSRRKRRRKRMKALDIIDVNDLEEEEEVGELAEAEADEEATQDADDSSSSFDQPYHDHFKSTPATPPRSKKEKRKERRAAMTNNPRLSHSKSTPSLRLSLTIPPDPRVLQLRSLAHKLRLLFPEDAKALKAILSSDFPESDNFVDPRGPAPRSQDTLIHVFIDHSNILIGMLSYLRNHRLARKKPHRLSHAALALILERGRPITRRVLVASSPLYQPMESAEQLGYEVRVYARVPDLGDGQDRRHHNPNSNSNSTPEFVKGHKRRSSYPSSQNKGHARKISGSTSTESEANTSGNSGSFSQGFVRTIAGRPPLSAHPSLGSNSFSNHLTPNAPGIPPPARIRYREQGVDELLQLKLHQAIADVDVPPPNATIVLATGDGNVGQFNEDGFLGPVRTALKKGWNVELYAWEEGLSKSWKREFGQGKYSGRFKVIEMEKFGADLLEI